MIVVDTSVWIEFFRANAKYQSAIVSLIEAGQIVALECVFGELLQGALDERERRVLEQFWEALPKVAVPNLLIVAGRLASTERFTNKGVGLIDAAIIAAARQAKARVWSLDKKLNAALIESERYAPRLE